MPMDVSVLRDISKQECIILVRRTLLSIFLRSTDVISVMKTAEITKVVASTIMTQTTPHSALSPITVATAAAQCLAVTLTTTTATTKMSTLPSPKKGKKHEDGWKEVVRRYSMSLELIRQNNPKFLSVINYKFLFKWKADENYEKFQPQLNIAISNSPLSSPALCKIFEWLPN